MIDYEANAEVISRINEIDEKLSEESDSKQRTRLMFEKLLRGVYLNSLTSF